MRLPLWLRAADLSTIGLLLLALFMLGHGGRVLSVGSVRISITSIWRVLAWAAGLAGIRHLIVSRPSLPRRFARGVISAIRTPDPIYDDRIAGRIGVPLAAASRRAARWPIVLVVLVVVYGGLTVLMTYPQIRVLDRGVSVDVGDPLLSTWRLEWIAHQLPRDPLHLFNANIFHPEPNTLAYSDAMLIPGLTAAPLVWLGVPPVLVHNLLLLSGFVFSGAAMFLLMWSLTRHVAASLLAGFVFAFLPFRFVHYAHLELQMTQWMPLCLWALHRTIKHGRLRDGLLTGGFLAAQTLSSWYYGIFLATYLLPVAAALLAGSRREQARRAIRQLAAGGVLAAVLIGPLTLPYFHARHVVGERPISEIEFYSATPLNYLAAHPRNALLGSLTTRWGGQERELFQGIVVPLIALVALWPPLSRARLGYALALALAFEISLGFNGSLYPWLHAHVLPYRGLRVPARMGMLVGLSLAILVGYGAARLLARPRSRRAAVVTFAVMVALVVGEERSRLVLKNVWTRPPDVYARIPRESDVVINLPFVAYDVSIEPYYEYFSTFHWHQIVNGYSGFMPPWYPRLAEAMARFPDDLTIAELRRHGVTFVIVHGAFYSPAVYERLVERMDQSADLVPDGRFRWQGQQTRLYRLRALPAATPGLIEQ
jgi:hypothetical protein